MKKRIDYANLKKSNKVLEIVHEIFLAEIGKVEFDNVSNYQKSTGIFMEVVNDFRVTNDLIKKNDLFNSATILRTIYENIVYIIVTSYDDKTIVTKETLPSELKNIVIKNCDKWFTEYIDEKFLREVYNSLCKLLHPCSIKELTYYFINEKKGYNIYMLMNLKYIMIVIEYMFLNFLHKKNTGEGSNFHLNLVDLCTYLNIVNVGYLVRGETNYRIGLENYLFYKDKDTLLSGNTTEFDNFIDEIAKNEKEINDDIKELSLAFFDQIKSNGYYELATKIAGE